MLFYRACIFYTGPELFSYFGWRHDMYDKKSDVPCDKNINVKIVSV